MFHGLTSCVSFDYVVNGENETDFLIRDFNVPINCVLLFCPNNQETYTVFINSLSSQVITTLEIIWKPTVKKVYVIYRNSKQALSERKLEEALS